MAYLTSTKPPISKAVNTRARILKYLSMKFLIFSPNFQMRNATKKNLAPRLTTEANMNIGILMLNIPEVMVNNLYGIGVNPAVKMIQKSHFLY